MTDRGRRVRLLATVVVFGLLALGTWRGDDDHFPFGPFRMFASTESLDGETTWLELEVVTVDGGRVVVADGGAGMRRAELEASIGTFLDDPSALAPLLATWSDRSGVEAAGIDVVRRHQPMADGQPAGPLVTEVVVAWRP